MAVADRGVAALSDIDQRLKIAVAEASYLYHPRLYASVLKLGFDALKYGRRSGGATAGSGADIDAGLFAGF
jgi:hypothetical protein